MSSQSHSPFSFVHDQPPATYTFVAIAVLLQIAVWAYPNYRPQDKQGARRALGAVTRLTINRRTAADKPFKPIRQLSGPFDLWNGEIWRVPVSSFHHANLWHEYNPAHLIMNCLAIAFMGGILEPRLGRWRYVAFFLGAITVSAVAEMLPISYGMGLSGGAYALFGLLFVLYHHEPAIAERVPPSFFAAGFGWLFFCMVLTYADMLAVGNIAHVTGLIYGWLFGQIFYVKHGWGDLGKVLFLAAHLFLIPAAHYIMHPFWLGTYHWYQANSITIDAADKDAVRARKLERKIAHLEQAVERDPSLKIPWHQLAAHYVGTGDRQKGWRTILQGIDYNRADDRAVKIAKEIWQVLPTPDERWQALQTIETVFGEHQNAWKHRLGILPGTRPRGRTPIAFEFGLPRPDVYLPQLEAEQDLRTLFQTTDVETHDLTAPPVEPDQPNSAAEGVSL